MIQTRESAVLSILTRQMMTGLKQCEPALTNPMTGIDGCCALAPPAATPPHRRVQPAIPAVRW